MFYYPPVLQRHTGCFSTIWLAATKGIKLTHRDFLKVNVQRTCSDILDYVLVRVPPPQPGLPRPRLSLYLSSQLQYGIVIVYHRQCGMLLDPDHSGPAGQEERLPEDRHGGPAQLSLPDSLSLREESEGAQDPFFGQMNVVDVLSPRIFMQLGKEQWRAATPERPLQLSPGTLLPGITASPDTITLVEKEPVVILSAEFEGVELAEVIPHEPGMIDLLMDQLDDFPEGEMEVAREAESNGAAAIDKDMSSKDPMILPQEDTGLPLDMPEAAAPAEERTPGPVPLPASPPGPGEEARKQDRERRRRSPSLPELSPPTPKEKRRHRKQLLFADAETQLSAEEQQRQLDDPLLETRRLADLPREMAVESELFQPDMSGSITPLEGSDLRELSREILSQETPESRGWVMGERDWERRAFLGEQMSRLQNIPEERDDVPFHSLLPPEAGRRTVSQSFWTLLEMVTAGKLRVHQDEPYGEITISPGTNYGEEEEEQEV
ncbi:meiotic recombination protein REC8 homolog [Aplochiton taeniatus]